MKTIRYKLLATIITILLISAFSVALAYGDAEGTSSGTAHVSSAVPTITSPEYWNQAEDTDVNNTALSVNTEYRVNFTVSDANTLADLDNVTIRVWLSGTATENGSDAEANHYSWSWVESTDTWSCIGPGAGYIVGASCADPGTAYAGTTYEFRLAFKFSRVAVHSATPNWKVSIFVWDDSDNADADTTLMSGIAFYSEITMTDTTHAWTGLTPGVSVNVTVDGDADIDFTVLANANWNATTKASGDLTKAPDTIPLTNLCFNKTGTAKIMTTGYLDIPGLTGQTPPTAEASPTATNEVLYLTVPGGTPSGDYTYTLYIKIIEA